MTFRSVGVVALLATAGLAVSLAPAKAISITGDLQLAGLLQVDTAADTITFGSTLVLLGTGDFASFTFPNSVTWRPSPTSYASQDLTIGSTLLGCGGVSNGGCLFESTQAGLTAAFDLDQYT